MIDDLIPYLGFCFCFFFFACCFCFGIAAALVNFSLYFLKECNHILMHVAVTSPIVQRTISMTNKQLPFRHRQLRH